MIKIEKKPYSNFGQCIFLSNEKMEVVITTEIGPRIIRLGFIGQPNMFCEDTERVLKNDSADLEAFGEGEVWYIYGGHRIWTSPEGSPRSYYPDNHPVIVENIANGVRITAPIEKLNLHQKVLEVTLSPNSNEVTVNNYVKNCCAWAQTFSVWALTVMSQGGLEVMPQPQKDTGLLGNRVLALWPYTNMADDRVVWGKDYILLSQDTNATEAFKFGINSEHGWAAYFNHNCLFVKKYQPVENALYPDFGVSFETYTNAFILEIETLGALTEVQPNETICHTEVWSLYENVKKPEKTEEAAHQVISKFL